MRSVKAFILVFMLSSSIAFAKNPDYRNDSGSGTFSLGTRNTLSLFSHIENETPGIGIGGQFRLQFSDKINTEWYLDYIPSSIGKMGIRNDYHIGWSVMYYFDNTAGFEKFVKPYLIAGHCFDYTEISSTNKNIDGKDRLSMATQAGLGTHFNITKQFDFSLSAQYMLHFGKEIDAYEREGEFFIEKADHSHVSGHLLSVLSVNYKFAKLW